MRITVEQLSRMESAQRVLWLSATSQEERRGLLSDWLVQHRALVRALREHLKLFILPSRFCGILHHLPANPPHHCTCAAQLAMAQRIALVIAYQQVAETQALPIPFSI